MSAHTFSPRWARRDPAAVAIHPTEARREWGFGGYVIWKHNRLLRTTCPRCLQQAMYRPVDGKLRLWCSRCRSCVDTMPELVAIRTWPPRVQPAERPCRAITLQPQARSLLLQLQADLLVLLAGQQTRRMWTGKLKPESVLEVLRDFSFVLLGPLGETPYRAAPGTEQHPGEAASRLTACPLTTGTWASCRPKLPRPFC